MAGELLLPCTAQPTDIVPANAEWDPRILINGLNLVDVATGSPGALINAATYEMVNQFGSFKINGITQYAYFPSQAVYNILRELTLVWIGTVSDFNDYRMLVTRSATNGALNNPFELRTDVTTGFITITRADASGYVSYSTSVGISANVLVTIVVTHNGTTANPIIFVNGTQYPIGIPITGGSGSGTANSAPLYLGHRADGYYGKGNTVLFAAFNRVFNVAEIKNITNNPWQLFRPRSIPVSGTRRPAKRKTFNLSVPHESPPNSLVEVDPSVAYAFNAGSGMLDLANNAPNWAGSSKISHYKDGLYLDGNMNTSHRRYSSFDNRSAFIIAGRSIRDNSYSSNASQVSAVGSYGWQLKLIDYSTAIRIEFNGYWSVSPCFIAYVWDNGWPGLKALNWAMAIDIPNLTYNIYLEGKAVASGVLTQVPDPVQDSGFVSIASVPSQGNVISQLCIIPGSDLVKAQELSKGVNQLFKPMDIPYASPQITTRREVSEMTLPWNSQPPENIRCDALVAFGPHGHIDIVSGRMMRIPSAHELRQFITPHGLGYLGAVTAARRAGRRVAGTVTAGTPLGLVWVFRNSSGTDNGGARISNTDNGFRLLEMTISAGVLSASARGSDGVSRTVVGPTIGTMELVIAVAEWIPGVGVSLAVNGVDYGTTAFGLTTLSHVPSILNDGFNTATVNFFTAWLRVDQLGDRVGLSRDPWKLMKDYALPFDQPALTRQLDPLTPTDGMTPRIYLGS